MALFKCDKTEAKEKINTTSVNNSSSSSSSVVVVAAAVVVTIITMKDAVVGNS